jgi:hypothetical protein
MRVLLTAAVVAGTAYLVVPQRSPPVAAPDQVGDERLAPPGSMLAFVVLLRTIGIIGVTTMVAGPLLQPRRRQSPLGRPIRRQ